MRSVTSVARFEETLDIARTAAVATTGVFVWVLLTRAERPNLSPSVPVMAGVLAVTGMYAVRFVIRAWRTNKVAARAAQKRVILLGAGEAGRRLVRHMLRDPNSGFSPVALLDDDRAKGRLRVEGVRVRGTRASMAAVAVEYDASTLVTGAGGSIGSELCRQIVRFGPPKLYLLDRDESGIHATQLSLTGQGLLEGDEVVLTDIRDAAAVREVFAQTRPDIVFHAAVLKHLPLLEQYPLEAWKTNVLGTLNVLRAVAAAGVGTFVNISTDKAASPICALGYSKRLAERITADFARTQPGRYVSVRFGNVLGSRGSVLHAFTTQIERGGPVTVTHPEVERFFMLIPEASQLVLEAAAMGSDGEVTVLEMGEPVRILDARTLIRRSGRTDVDSVFTGLRPDEKLSEDLVSDRESRRATSHPLVTSVDVPGIDVGAIVRAPPADHAAAVAWMRGRAVSAERANA